MSKDILDITCKEWSEYYNKCDLECNNGKMCPMSIGNACLGDIIDFRDKKQNDPDYTLRKAIDEANKIRRTLNDE